MMTQPGEREVISDLASKEVSKREVCTAVGLCEFTGDGVDT